MIRSVLVFAVTLGLSAPGLAAADPCRGTTTPEMNACAANELKTSDAALNTTYQTLKGRIGPKAQAGLRAAQEAWLTFRDRSCALETMGTEGGSVQRLVELGCLKTITDDRTKALTRYLTCEEGDLSCVGRFGE